MPGPNTRTVFADTEEIIDSDTLETLEGGVNIQVNNPTGVNVTTGYGGRQLDNFYKNFQDASWVESGVHVDSVFEGGAAYNRWKRLSNDPTLTESERAELKFLESVFASDKVTFDTISSFAGTANQNLSTLQPRELEEARAAALTDLQTEVNRDLPTDDTTIRLNSQQTALFLLYEQLNDYFFKGDYYSGETGGRSLEGGYFPNNEVLKVDFPQNNTIVKSPTRNSDDDMHMFYLKNAAYGHLVPDVKLYKITNKSQKIPVGSMRDSRNPEDEGELIEVERYFIDDIIPLSFPRATDDQEFLENSPTSDAIFSQGFALTNRAGQVGIKSFNWRYVGTDAFTADRDIEAELTLSMDGIEALFAEREDPLTKKPYRLSDALILPQCYEASSSASPQNAGTTRKFEALGPSDTLPFRPECFELIVDAGYSCDPTKILTDSNFNNFNELSVAYEDLGGENDPNFPQVSSQSFDKFRTSLILGVVDHEFNFNENGSVEVEIKYRGRLGGHLRGSKYNIIFSFALRDRLEKLELEMKKLQTKMGEIQNLRGNTFAGSSQKGRIQKDYDDLKEEYDGLMKSNYGRFFSNIVERLRTDKKIYSLNLSAEQVKYLHAYLATSRKSDLYNYINSMTINGELSDPAASQFDYDDDIGFQPAAENNFVVETVNRFRSLSSLRAFMEEYRRNLTRLQNNDITGVSLEATDPDLSVADAAAVSSGFKFTCYLGEEKPKNIPFVFLGDLLDAVMRMSGLHSTLYDSRVILGDIRLPRLNPLSRDPKDQNVISLASIPISIPRLFNFITKEITAQSAVEMPFSKFVSLVLNKLVKESLGIETIENALQTDNINFKTTYMTHYPAPGVPRDPTKNTMNFETGEAQALSEAPVFDDIKTQIVDLNGVYTNVNSTIDKTSQEFVDFLKNNPPINLMIIHESDERLYIPTAGNLKEDFLNRIPHYSIGQNFGLIKNVKLAKTDQPFLREARFQKLGGHYSITQLSNVYDAQFEMFGNDLNTLGGLIYFNPDSLSPLGLLGDPQDQTSLSYILGFGGLHLVTLIDHSMTPGDYTTTVKARFVSRGFVKPPESA